MLQGDGEQPLRLVEGVEVAHGLLEVGHPVGERFAGRGQLVAVDGAVVRVVGATVRVAPRVPTGPKAGGQQAPGWCGEDP